MGKRMAKIEAIKARTSSIILTAQLPVPPVVAVTAGRAIDLTV
jgi:hypothetical protein